MGIGPTTRPGRKKRVVILSPTAAAAPFPPSFLPAAKPTGHITVRVVVVVVVVVAVVDYFEVMTLKADLRSRST